MKNKNTITIVLSENTLDTIRKLAIENYRSINKQLAYIIEKYIDEDLKNDWK